ncbi:alpha-E domain-containing protein [Nitrincola tibetensis]|uniref:Alpha-E domain-containing protein n=1 Tax=Nitrincola tibetensis TaxID=2219697 RepID=A0A364NM72_9GAMM|nr:alpha-E domain-containing protein [Nitrincola tibetensis]RAU18196.1 alpha-E domain-containing protein [Nitrincola tibetensis]
MLSRVAESVYWMARYLERAEDTARLISVNSHLLLDFPKATRLGWSSLVTITSSDEVFDKYYTERDEESVLSFFCGDRRYSGSIVSSLAAARENLRTTRDVMPQRIWEEVNQLFLAISHQVEAGITPRNRDAFLNRVIRSCETVNGMIEGTLSYTQVRTFLQLGRSIERADMTTRIIDVRSENLLPRTPEEMTPFETLQWVSVLKSLTGFQMYRQHVRLRVRGPDVLRFLLQDVRFPRAVACTLTQVCAELSQLPGHVRALAAAQNCLAHITSADIPLLSSEPDQLHQYIDQLQIDFLDLHDAVVDTWFTLLHEKEIVAQLAQTQTQN